MSRTLRQGSIGEEVQALQANLNLRPPTSLAFLATDGHFGSKTERRVREFQRLNSLKDDGVVGPRTTAALNHQDPLSSISTHVRNGGAGAVLAASTLASTLGYSSGVMMGVGRTVQLQPIFLKAFDADIPTGGWWPAWVRVANQIWNKLGVSFLSLPPLTIVHPDPLTKLKHPDALSYKYYGDTNDETMEVRKLVSGYGVHIFVVENEMPLDGGGNTYPWASEKAKIVISDMPNTSLGLLAHELGHVLGLDHPSYYEDKNPKPQIMTPAGSFKGPHYSRNPLVNYHRITWPPPSGAPVAIYPDP